jgi:hypothetical protein
MGHVAVGTVKKLVYFFPLYCNGWMHPGQTGQTVNTQAHEQTYETVAFCGQRREEMEEKGRRGGGVGACDTMWEQQETEQAARVLGHAAVL